MSSSKTLESVLALAIQNDRVCPMPQQWNRLYELLPNRHRVGSGWQPALPLILAAWYEASDSLKTARLNEHIEWAHSHGAIDAVATFLASLAESEWHHRGD